ncbi:FecR family protein [Chitinophaga polysaccharea]|uniref:FecR family protein n=1 Tax=Chitinophaga polysaccharea TaxID=1293035 RepID=A0A561PXW6_9BACT|nr:FecR domain-containing protein [Chitinophaga polysaccharea]TWF42949.1 FecR family protein [Chitinophaga polysaccharea]
MSTGEEYMDTLLARHFAGETNGEEEAILKKWMTEHPETYLSLRILWAESSAQVPQVFDTQLAWQKAEQLLASRTSGREVPFYRKYRLAIGVAAAVACIAIGLWQYITSPVTEHAQMAEVRHIVLPDGSSVTLNRNASITYNRYFLGSRKVSATGEVFFEVVPGAAKPFIVSTEKLEVSVLGTSFLVKAGNSPSVSVITGKVAVRGQDGERAVVLTPNQTARYENGVLLPFPETDVNLLSWKTQTLVFNGTPLSKAFSDIEKCYGVTISAPRTADSCKITSRFEHTNLDGVLKELSILTGFHYSIKNKEITIEGLECK